MTKGKKNIPLHGFCTYIMQGKPLTIPNQQRFLQLAVHCWNGVLPTVQHLQLEQQLLLPVINILKGANDFINLQYGMYCFPRRCYVTK
ncbi:hypothetical protein T4B_3992 [Trichinella pseudospiralis]|uniref:Uncharacterized protein n=1 Tax=Trichinella pseudospiralis TaxID=6337 RepID=A0A0V1GQM6_TRIPS|nr:hypothetical protein T4B_3992 [Trichinella pseudospiralis]